MKVKIENVKMVSKLYLKLEILKVKPTHPWSRGWFGPGSGFRIKAKVFLEFSLILFRNNDKLFIELISLNIIMAEAENFVTFFLAF